ncbi:phage tail protein [Stutzerimonas nitrititolerans]|uniref:phage tail protein n=1 Tax=Stutzerimonas nitrititolerans TaxID=2482751 RepID=UPI0028ADE432|nr:phage tail protein [Stutzerimonas nitrititolerans]
MARITLAGEDLIAQKQAAQQPLNITRFIFANVPGLSPNNEVDRAAPKPPAGQVVYSAVIPPANKGYVNPSQVVYSLQVGSDVGDWDFNWIGLESAEGVLFAVAYMPLQQKRRNIPPLQLGNNITRNFLVVFDGAQALTGITIDASTWQHDFTVRLAGIDERERQGNRDIYGRACFFGSALQLEKVGDTYQLKPGTAYIEGVRLQRAEVLPVVPPALPTTAWLDVALQRELNDVAATWSVVWGNGKVDYVDSAGVQHYCVAIADLPTGDTITDSRPVETIDGPLVTHFAAREGDYDGLRARATTKEDVGLGNLPNAKSDDENTDSSLILATTKAVKAATAVIWTAIANIVSGITVVGKAETLATSRRVELTGPVTGEALFDGSTDIKINTQVPLASETTAGISEVATKYEVLEGISNSAFISPKTLRWGFAISLGENGYIVAPTWLGSWILQWVNGVPASAESEQAVPWPIAFPSNCRSVLVSTNQPASSYSNDGRFELISKSMNGCVVRAQYTNTVAGTIFPTIWAIGS